MEFQNLKEEVIVLCHIDAYKHLSQCTYFFYSLLLLLFKTPKAVEQDSL